MPKVRHLDRSGPHLRIVLNGRLVLGPGRADLLEQIGRTGSIASAGRAMGMSYARAWKLAEDLNAVFSSPLIVAAKGGSGGGGAYLTELGEKMLAVYRRMETKTAAAIGTEIAAVRRVVVRG